MRAIREERDTRKVECEMGVIDIVRGRQLLSKPTQAIEFAAIDELQCRTDQQLLCGVCFSDLSEMVIRGHEITALVRQHGGQAMKFDPASGVTPSEFPFEQLPEQLVKPHHTRSDLDDRQKHALGRSADRRRAVRRRPRVQRTCPNRTS